jgi:hypothetical protein
MKYLRYGAMVGAISFLAACEDSAQANNHTAAAQRPLTGQVNTQAFPGMVSVRAIDTLGGFVDAQVGADGAFQMNLSDNSSYLLVLMDAQGEFGPPVFFERNRLGELTRALRVAPSLNPDLSIRLGRVEAAADNTARVELQPLAQVDSDEDGEADIDDADDDSDGVEDEADDDDDGDGVGDDEAEHHEHGDDDGDDDADDDADEGAGGDEDGDADEGAGGDDDGDADEGAGGDDDGDEADGDDAEGAEDPADDADGADDGAEGAEDPADGADGADDADDAEVPADGAEGAEDPADGADGAEGADEDEGAEEDPADDQP